MLLNEPSSEIGFATAENEPPQACWMARACEPWFGIFSILAGFEFSHVLPSPARDTRVLFFLLLIDDRTNASLLRMILLTRSTNFVAGFFTCLNLELNIAVWIRLWNWFGAKVRASAVRRLERLVRSLLLSRLRIESAENLLNISDLRGAKGWEADRCPLF